jgi:hypothetical protein
VTHRTKAPKQHHGGRTDAVAHDNRADAEQAGQGGAGSPDCRGQLLGAFAARAFQAAHVEEQLGGQVVAREGLRIEVDALEAIDGTPVVDVKPAIDPPT